jgi:AcrR family transcriptional regulator
MPRLPSSQIASPRTPSPRRLNETVVVDRALQIVKDQGLEELSMRRLASELGVTAMALYHHVGSKDELIQLVANRVFDLIGDQKPDGDWSEILRARTLSIWQEFSEYPGLAAYVLDRPLTPGVRRSIGLTIEMFRSIGMDDVVANHAYWTYHTYIYGLLTMEARFGHLDDNEIVDRVTFGIDTLIAGLRALLPPA